MRNAETIPDPLGEEMASEMELSAENIRALASLSQYAGDSELRGIEDYESAVALAEEIHGQVLDIAEELGSGFALLEDKTKLIKAEFVIIQWRFSHGDHGTFASVALVTKRGEKYIINDGGTGIMQMLLEFSQRTKRFGGIKVANGLRKSDYPTCPDCGKPLTRDEIECMGLLPNGSTCGYSGESRGLGVTYYLDTSAASN